MPTDTRKSDQSLIKLADLIIDPVRRQVRRRGELLELPELSFDLLLALARAAPDALSYQQLMDRVWPDRVVNEETITQRVRLVRKALGDQRGSDQLIITQRGVGYRLAAAPESANQSRLPLVLMASLIFAAIAVLAWWQWPGDDSQSAAPEMTQVPGPNELVERGWTYFSRHQQDDNERAVALFERALLAEPEHVEALTGLSMARAQRSTKFNAGPEEIEAALELAQRALALAPEHANAHAALAFALDGQGAIADAIASYERALAINPDHVGALASVAYLYHVRGELSRALQYNLRAVNHANRLHYLDLQIGNGLHLLGFAPAAEPYFERAELLRPENVFAPVERARFLIAQGRRTEAEAVIAAAIQRQVRRPELYVLRGMLALSDQNYESALQDFELAREIAPYNGFALTWQMVALCQSGQPNPEGLTARVQMLTEAVHKPGHWPSIPLQLLDLHAACGEAQDAALAMDQLFAAGYRDVSALRFRPSLQSIHASAEFAQLVEAIQLDLAQQRREVISATWLPEGFLTPAPMPEARP